MTRTRKVATALFFLILIAAAVYFWPKTEPVISKASTPAVQAPLKLLPDGRPAAVDPDAAKRGVKEDFRPDTNAIMAFAAALMKPFHFVGKVVDQNGEPVPIANVRWGANNSPDPYKSGTRGETTSDANGFFFIDSTGIGLFAEVSKPGYDHIPSELGGGKRGSSGGFVTGGRLGKSDSPMGTRDDPSIFVLRKMGETVPLIHLAERSVMLPKNGSPVEVSLESGQNTTQGGLSVQCWTNDQVKKAEGQYDWKCLLTVSGGGLIERTDSTVFEAPASGYQESVELAPSAEKWASKIERQYFIKLPDDRYARINFRLRTAGEHFFVLESFLNPTPGNRNLEFDPAKTVKSP
jgi:hypothetical protein